jgi:hypothetical protein
MKTASTLGKGTVRTFMFVALGIVPVNVAVWLYFWRSLGSPKDNPVLHFAAFTLLALAQLVCGVVAAVKGFQERRATEGARGLGPAIVGVLVALAAPVGWVAGAGVVGLLLVSGWH